MMKVTTACWETVNSHVKKCCAKVIGLADSICYRLNRKITAAEPSPVEELPSSISSRPNRATRARHGRKKISFVEDDTPPHDEHILVSLNESRQVTTVSSPLESYVTFQQEQIKCQILKAEAIQRKIDAYKGERTPTVLISSLPVCRKCHWREWHNRLNCPYPLSCSSSVYCKNISKHTEEKTVLKEVIKQETDEGSKLASMREELTLKQQAASKVTSRYVNRVKDTIDNSNRSREIHQRSKWKSHRRLAQDKQRFKTTQKEELTQRIHAQPWEKHCTNRFIGTYKMTKQQFSALPNSYNSVINLTQP